MTKLTWLHLSDWHQGIKEFDRKVVLDRLLADIRARTKISPDLETLDFIIFSGDVAQSGKSEEYEAAQIQFFEPVLQATGVSKEQLFIVPGNHDLQWNDFKYLPQALLHPLTSNKEVEEWFEDKEGLESLLKPFRDYSSFVKQFVNADQTAYSYLRSFEAGGKRIAVIGLNSALLSGRHKEVKDGKEIVNDDRYLILGEPQFYYLMQESAFSDADIRIAVMHHPFDWLIDFDRTKAREALKQNCHFILHGHVHLPEVIIEGGTGGDCITIPAGASYDRREPVGGSRYANAYNYVHLDTDTGDGTVYLRRYEDRQGWLQDSVSTGDEQPGFFTFKHRTLGSPEGKKRTSSPPEVSSSSRFERERVVLEGYLNALIRNNTDLEPGGIKQTNVNVVLPLDSIYVGLQADHDRPDVDRRVMQEELDEIKKNLGREEDPKEREKQYQIWAHHSRVIQRALEISGPREDLSTIVQRHRQAVILGDPGSGKTTLVRYLTLRLARAVLAEPERLFETQELWDEKKVWSLSDLGPVRLPILLRISHYAEARQKDPDLALVEYLPRYFAGLSVPHVNELGPLLQRLLDDGRCMVLLDGLDEIIDPTDRRNIATAIGQFASVYRETGLPDWLPRLLSHMSARTKERQEAQAKSEEKEINIQWAKDTPEDVRLEWGKRIKQRHHEWQRRGRAMRMAWELLDEARYAHVGNRFVVTSRIAGYHFAGVPGEFEHYTIRRMSLEDIKLFLEKWCPAVERRIAEAPDPAQVEQRSRREIDGILKAVETTPGVRRMAENPLLLRILAIIHRNEAHLPQRRVELYETASVTLLRDWHLERGSPKGAVIDDVKATSLLGPLALYIHENRASGFLSKGETESILGGILARERGEKDPEQPSLESREAVRDFLETVREHSGLFVERGEGLYGFMHLTFEEYFTARQLVSSATRARAQILERLHQPRWREPILLAVGSLSKQFYDDTHDLLRAILEANSPYEGLLHRDLLFTAACVGDSVNVAPVLRQEIARKMLALYCDRRHAGRFRLLQQQVKDALLTLCNDQGDAAVEDALAETLAGCAGGDALSCALDAVDWLKARTHAVADALAAHPELGTLPRAHELLRSVQARLPVNGDGGRPALLDWNAVRNDPALARLMGALWHYNRDTFSMRSLEFQKDALENATHALRSLSLKQPLDSGKTLLQRFNDTPIERRDTDFWKSVARMLQATWRVAPKSSEIEVAAKQLMEAVINSLEKQEDALEAVQYLRRASFDFHFLPHTSEEPTRDMLPLEQALARFGDILREVERTIAKFDFAQGLQSAGSYLLKGASAGDTLAATFAASAGRFSSPQSLSDEATLIVNVRTIQSELGQALLALLRSPTNGQQYHEAALFLAGQMAMHFGLDLDAESKVVNFRAEAADIICTDLEGADASRRRWALQALMLPAIRRYVDLNEERRNLLMELLDASTDQATMALAILFSLDFTSDLLSWCWATLRRPNHPLGNVINEHLAAVKQVEGDQQTLALLDEGLRDDALRPNAMELLRRISWQGTDTFIQALIWLSSEDSAVRHLAAMLLAAQNDLLAIPRSVLISQTRERAHPTGPSSWSALAQDAHTVRLFSGLWLYGWDDALTQLWVAQPAQPYVGTHLNKSLTQFSTYPECDECIHWLLEKAEFGQSLIPIFQNAATRLVELEGTVAPGAPQAEHISIVQLELLQHIEELLAQPDISPLLRAELIIFVVATNNNPLLRTQCTPDSDQPLAVWLRYTLAAQNLTLNSSLNEKARLLTNDNPDARAAASLALFAADLPSLLVVALIETVQSPDDRVRMKGMRSLIDVGGKLPCDGSTDAVETLLSSLQNAIDCKDGIMKHLLFNALLRVEYTRPFWVARWLNIVNEEGRAHQLALLGLRNVHNVSKDVLSLICFVLNDHNRPLAARRAIAISIRDILRGIQDKRSDQFIHIALTTALDDPDTEIRHNAVYAMQWTSGQVAWPTAVSLLRVAQTDSDATTRVMALGSMGRVLHTVRGFRDVDVSKEGLFRWLKERTEERFRFGRDKTAKAVRLLPKLLSIKEAPDAEAVLTILSHPENLDLSPDDATQPYGSKKWHTLVKDARQEWDLRRFWLETLTSLPATIAQMEDFLSAADPLMRRAAARALARLYDGEDDRPARLRDLLHDDPALLRALLDATTDMDPWLDEDSKRVSHHSRAVKQIAGWVEAKSPEERGWLIDSMLDSLDKAMQGAHEEGDAPTDVHSGWPIRNVLTGVLAELSERLTYRAFINTRDLENVVALFAHAAADQDSRDSRRFAIRALGNLQQLTGQVANVFFAACQDMQEVYRETRIAVTKFKVFDAGSLERLTAAIRNPSITVAYHAALLLAELGISRSEDLGREGRKRVADELVHLLDAPLTHHIVYDFSQNIDGTPVGFLYDIIYEALVRVVAGPDAPGNVDAQDQRAGV